MKLCFLALLLALLRTKTTPVSGAAVVATNNRRRSEETSLAVPSTGMLAGCQETCGNLSLAYPFGIGSGCFRDPDFNLTCIVDGADDTPRLFLPDGITQVVDDSDSDDSGIHVGLSDHISISYSRNVSVVTGVDVYNISWSPPGRSFVLAYASINVTGCGFDVSMLDHDTGASYNICSTTCPGREITEATARHDCNGTWCCSVPFENNIGGFQFSFFRRLEEVNSSVHHTSPLWNQISVTTDYAELQWNMVDQPTCADAERHTTTYACISNHSSCNEYGSQRTYGGYQCSCDGGYLGNPYVPDGCLRDRDYRPSRPSSRNFQEKRSFTRKKQSRRLVHSHRGSPAPAPPAAASTSHTACMHGSGAASSTPTWPASSTFLDPPSTHHPLPHKGAADAAAVSTSPRGLRARNHRRLLHSHSACLLHVP